MKRALTALLGTVLVGVPVLAHHGRGATYDDTKILTIKAKVTEVDWRNPHVAIYVDVTDDAGKVVNWGLESQNVSSLTRLRFYRNTLKVGQEVTVKLNPARSGAPVGVLRKLYDASGKEVLSFGGPIDE